MAFNFGPNIVREGLVMYFDAANSKSYVSGSSTIYDMTLSQNTGSLTSSASFSSNNLGIITLNGTSDYIDCGAPDILPRGFTVSIWVKPNSVSGVQELATYRSTINGQPVLFQMDVASGGVRFIHGPFPYSVAYGSTLQVNNWYNIVGVRHLDDSTSVYVNKVKGTDGSILANNNIDVDSLNLGAYANASTTRQLFFSGSIATFMIHNKVLSQQEITRNYNVQKSRFGVS